jgi:hypothetical protein
MATGWMTTTTARVIDLARSYLSRGWRVIPVPYRAKVPTVKGWPDLRLDEHTLHDQPEGVPHLVREGRRESRASEHPPVVVLLRPPDGRFIAVVDRVIEVRPPFNPENVTRDFAALARGSAIATVYGDRFAGGWTDAAFVRAGLQYEPSPLSKSEIYLAMLSLINSKQVELPDIPRLVTQLSGLQRRVRSGGRESVDHAPRVGAHDDLANCAAGAAVLVHRMMSAPRVIPVFI